MIGLSEADILLPDDDANDAELCIQARINTFISSTPDLGTFVKLLPKPDFHRLVINRPPG